MGRRKVAIGLNASAQPNDSFGICADLYLGHACNMHPAVGEDIPRGETESLEYMAFCLSSAAHKIPGNTDGAVSADQLQSMLQLIPNDVAFVRST